MKSFKEPSHFFNLNTRPTKSGEHLIFFNLNYGYRVIGNNKRVNYLPMRISTSYKIKKEYWNEDTYRASSAYVRIKGKDLNDTLDIIQKTAYHQLSIFRNHHNEDPSPSILKKLIEEKLGRKDKISEENNLIDFIQNHLENRHDLKIDTKKQYKTLLRNLKQYEKYKNTKLVLGKLTSEWYWDFFNVTNNIYFEKNGLQLTQTTIAKDCKNLRAIFNSAMENDIPIGFNFKKKA
jgi:hypothetical protein